MDSLPDRLEDLEDDLHLTGLVAIADRPRREVADAVATCRAAGITPVMITGDHPRTAAAIARRLGILDGLGEDEVLTGGELAELSGEDFAARVASVRVYARTTPEQKLRIVDAWKAPGAVVAMTGDGVNDAPALQRADIGVAMGVAGTDVSKEAADMVLADDNFATIIEAVVLPLQAASRAADWPWQTMTFSTVARLQLGHALAVRSEEQSLFRWG